MASIEIEIEWHGSSILADPNFIESIVRSDVFLEAIEKLSGSFDLLDESSGS